MAMEIIEPMDFRFKSKNSKYLDPKHKALAKRAYEQERRIQDYYTFQSKIYDSTRWSFLFGRKELLNHFPYADNKEFSVLEVGCGTGYNLKKLNQKFPKAQLTGIDVSNKMIAITRKKLKATDQKVNLINAPYNEDTIQSLTSRPQIIVFSYALTMINPHWKELVLQAKKDLTTIGYIAVVDFHYSPFSWFRNHMQQHHVRMNGHILPFLKDNFEPVYESVDTAYLGLWQYFTFVGKLVD